MEQLLFHVFNLILFFFFFFKHKISPFHNCAMNLNSSIRENKIDNAIWKLNLKKKKKK